MQRNDPSKTSAPRSFSETNRTQMNGNKWKSFQKATHSIVTRSMGLAEQQRPQQDLQRLPHSAAMAVSEKSADEMPAASLEQHSTADKLDKQLTEQLAERLTGSTAYAKGSMTADVMPRPTESSTERLTEEAGHDARETLAQSKQKKKISSQARGAKQAIARKGKLPDDATMTFHPIGPASPDPQGLARFARSNHQTNDHDAIPPR